MINSYSNLILIKNEDKTENIETWTYRDGFYFITFHGGKTYKYSYLNVKFYKDPRILDLNNTMVMKNNIPLYAVKQVLMFEYHSKIIYENGYKETVANECLYFCQSALCNPKSKECFEYLKQIAILVGLQDEKGNNILANRYQKINFIREDCILTNYLSGKLNPTIGNRRHPIYPFGLILQMMATDLMWQFQGLRIN